MSDPKAEIEAIAKAMCRADWGDEGRTPDTWKAYEGEARKFCAAHYTLELLREERMQEGSDRRVEALCWPLGDAVKRHWRALWE